MGTSDAAKIPMHNGDVAEDSETTVQIKIKTLDSQTHTLRVNKCVSVPALKEQIATITGVLSEQQRLICRGRVLKDDQLLSAYHVEDGHTLHLVVRQPHQSSSPFIGYEGLSGIPAANSASESMPNHSNQVSRTVVLETVNIGQGDVDSTVLGRIVENILNSFGPTISGIGNVRAEYQEANSDRLPRPFGDIGVSSTENQPNISSQRMESNWPHATFRFPSAVSSVPQTLPAIPHSLTTLRQYIDHLKYEFRREMPGSTADRDHSNSGEAFTMHLNDGEDLSQSHQSCRRDDLSTPVVLAEILQTTRQLLAEQAEESLLRLSRELENHMNITDTQMRTIVQSSAIRTGFLLQNLGSLLLELGRTTMTLHMGQMPSEAIVNAGPAVFVSASGPNPVMVQPVPFYPAPSFRGAHMGSTNSGHGHDGEGLSSAFSPRNIDIRIHAVPLPAGSHSGQSGAQQQHENSDPARSSAHRNSVHQAGPGHPGSAPLTGEYGVRVVPVRTVVAMPVGLSNSQSNLSGNSAALLYPLLASIQQQNGSSANNAPGSQASPLHQQGGVEQSQEHIPDSIRQILESYIGGSIQEENPASSYTVPVVSGTSMSTNAQVEHNGSHAFITSHRMTPNGYNERSSHIDDGQDARQGSMPQFASEFEQWSRTFLGEQVNIGGGEQQGPALCSGTEQTSTDRETELNEASRSVNDQGVLFSNFLHQVMPLIMEGTAREQGVSRANQNPLTFESLRESSNGASSSLHQRDPPEAPSQKRHKGE